MTTVLEIRLFGGVEIRQNGALLSSFVSHKVPALLAYLVVTGRPHSRDTLAALLWGELSDADAKNNLRQALSNLRKLVEPYLLITRDTVAWNAAASFTLDIAQFETHLRAGRDVPPAIRAEAFQRAAALYQGDFLAGFFVREAPEFEEWMLGQRVRYRELALHALHTLCEYHLGRGEYSRTIDFASRLLALDPWREGAYRQLMLALSRSGQRAAALAQYETCRRILEQELGVAPAAETTALYQRIKAAGDAPRPRLPLQPTPFVGRTAELAEIESLLLRPECRLITLLGAGGIGKTRLGLQAAAQASQHGLFLQGVFFVPLEGVETVTGLATAMAHAVSFPFGGGQEPTAQLLEYLQERELLLVLDNFEQLLDTAPWLITLLQQAPGVKLLLTSRERLHLQWEWCVALEGLNFPAAGPASIRLSHPADSLPDAAAYSAVQLFIARARSARHDFAPDAAALTHIIHICQLTAGMPLALELAAANIPHFTCAEIATSIAQNLDFLTSAYRDIPTRQRSLRAVFDYSWGLLTPAEQQLFAALSLFRGGFTQDAAGQVAGGTRPLLASLADKSLLRWDERSGRYFLHEMTRHYAAQRLDETPQAKQPVYRRYAEHFLALAEKAETEFHGEQQEAWVARLELEHNNVRNALEWCWQTGAYELYGRLAGAIWPFWYLRSYYREGLNWLQPVLEHTTGIPQPIQAKLLRGAGVMANQLADYETAIAYLSQTITILHEIGEPSPLARALNSLAVVYHAMGDYSPARALWEQCLTLQQAAADRIGMAQTLQNLSALELDEGNLARVLELGTEALRIFRAEGIKWGIAYVSINLGTCLLEQGDLPNARTVIMESLILCRELGSMDSVADCLDVLAGVEARENQPVRAVIYVAAADKIRVQLGNQRHAGGVVAYERLLTDLRAHLVPAIFQAAWDKGSGLDSDLLLDAVQTGDLAGLTIYPAAAPSLAKGKDLSGGSRSGLPVPMVEAALLAAALAGLSVGNYVIESLVARGGMGELYRAVDRQTGQIVALKRLLPHLVVAGSDYLARFRREAEVLRRLNHPNIVKMIEAIELDDQLTIVMEYVPGGSLQQLLAAGVGLPRPQAVTIALELADALARTHHLGIIHRDLKPANVLIAEDGTPRLTDFGIARLGQGHTRLTQQGTTLGTAAYMAPEAYLGEELDSRADVWSFGVMLYEMLAGRNPFVHEQIAATITGVLYSPLPDIRQDCPDIPASLAHLLQQMLVRERPQRLGSMRQVAAILEQVA
ncbi:MAG: protein kinase [Anaerolineae bacterium]|nr:protein kinase [Anaerolineae bacterium]